MICTTSFVCLKDGRLRIGDRILNIDESDVQGLNSSEVIGILRKCGTRVRLEVSRPHASDVQCIPAMPDLPASSSPMQVLSVCFSFLRL